MENLHFRHGLSFVGGSQPSDNIERQTTKCLREAKLGGSSLSESHSERNQQPSQPQAGIMGPPSIYWF